MKTSDLVGPALDYAVALARGIKLVKDPFGYYTGSESGWWVDLITGYQRVGGGYSPSTNRHQGFLIAEEELIAIDVEHGGRWRARFGRARITFDGRAHHYHHQEGPTPLIAAMRCFVYSKLGDEVEIPEELQ